jgi:Tol biopolymer transport system component
MALNSGSRLGPYEILAPLGAGGMGEVYRARDTRLERTVAIKILPAQFSSDPVHKQRFEREAKTISNLNHPHICVLHDIGQQDGTDYLVMECVEGETLAKRLEKGPLPLEQVLKLGAQIANALHKAHRAGIVHRDLKPGNIMLTATGAKLLDFGLAKPATALVGGMTLTAAAAQTTPVTQEGVVVGTFQYMSPEQVEGKELDGRSDIFSLGAVLYEMLTGKKAFEGKSQLSVASAILEKEPAPISMLQPLTPPALDHAIRRCLAKDPEERWQTAHDLALELKWTSESPMAGAQVAARGPYGLWLLAGGLAIVGMVALAGWWRTTRPVDHPFTRLSVDLGPEAVPGISVTAAISPDGRRLVFPARGPDGKRQFATRLLDQAQATFLPGTEGGSQPFFSPDGQWIGFLSGNQLKKISVQGGAPISLGVAPNSLHGASWGKDGSIVLELGSSVPLVRISDLGGKRQNVTKLGSGEVTHRWPQILQGGDAVLFTSSPSATSMENASIEVASLRTGQVKVLQRGGYYGRYLPSGHLVYLHQGVLFGVKFDREKLEVRGSPVPLLEDVAANASTGGGQFDFSSTGTFVYIAGKSAIQPWQLAWLDSSGKMLPAMRTPGEYGVPRLSPDGRKLTFIGSGPDIYIADLERDTTTRITFIGDAAAPIWAPDGKHLLFTSALGLFWVRSDGAAEPQRLVESQTRKVPWSISPDGRFLAYFEATAEGGFDIWMLPLDLGDPDHPKPGKPELFLRTPADALVPRFSPDGHWIAYRSTESGDAEIYVRPFPASNGGKWQISTGGGLYGLWSNNGHQLFYEAPDNRIMVVDYAVEGGAFMPGKARVWSDKQLFYTGTSNLDLAPDSKRFLIFSTPEAPSSEKGSVHVTMLLNFFDEVKRRIP